MGNVDTGGNGVQGVWGTWPMRPTGAKWYRGMGHIANRDTGANGVWGYGGIWAMRPTGGMGYRGTSHMGNSSTGGMLCVKMSKLSKDVKCQIVKHLDYGGGSQKK